MDFETAKRLFEKCAYRSDYDTIGNDVNYKFDIEGSHLYIYFQGSKDIRADKGWIDWLRNFWFFPTKKKPYKGMEDPFYVHSGFLSAWKEIDDLIISEIIKTNGFGRYLYDEITVVGYSHGGALATLAHECCWFYRPDIRDHLITYAFEAPRAYGGFKTKKSLKERWETCFVFRNGKDIVTRCPPRLFGFCHVGNIIQINGDLDTVKDDVWECVKYHYPQCVADGLRKAYEEK